MNIFSARLGRLAIFGLVLMVLFTPALASAQLSPTNPAFQVVPDCGLGELCGYCDLITLSVNIIQFLVYFSVFVAVVMIIYAGFLLLVGGSKEGERTKAKKVLYAAVIGLLITLTAWLIINLIMTVFLNASFNIWTLPGCP